MSKFVLSQHPEDTNHVLSDAPAIWQLDRDEAATIWYALSEYKKQLVANAAKAAGAGDTEDETFAYEHAAKCSKLQFDMRDNHVVTEAARVRTWLDCD
jgi:hypothetical protein